MRRSNPSFSPPSRAMDCFAEPVIGRRFAPTRWLAMTTNREACLSRQHSSAGFLPGVDAAGDMGGVGEARLPGGGDRHRGALAEGAEEHDAATSGGGDLAQHAAGLEAFADRGL